MVAKGITELLGYIPNVISLNNLEEYRKRLLEEVW